MNKVQHINLGGVPFTIDEGAFEHLSAYLETIHRHFHASEGYGEITADIEARMAELFQESLAGQRTIITLRDVKDAIVIMGTPEDFGAEPIEERAIPRAEQEGDYRPGKRLFRNPDDEVLGGVCSGIAAYFGIQDPLWIRLLFVIITVSGGFGIPAYIILWAVVPKAKTAGDRLAMRGEPINVSNIGKIVEEEFSHLSHKVQEFGNELGSKKKPFEGADEVGEILRRGIAALGKGIRMMLDIISNVWKPILIFVGALFIFAFAAAWIGVVGGMVFAWPLFEFFTPERSFLSILAAFNILMIIGLVLLGIVLSITRLLYGTQMSAPWRAGLAAFWVVNLASLGFVGASFAQDFVREGEVSQESRLPALPNDTLSLEMIQSELGKGNISIGNNDLVFLDDQLLIRGLRINLEKTDGDEFVLTKRFKARGADAAEAQRLASQINFQPELSDNKLEIPSHISISKTDKWRVQEIHFTIGIPQGKAVRVSGSLSNYVKEMAKADRKQFLWRNPGSTWLMTESGLSCLDCTE